MLNNYLTPEPGKENYILKNFWMGWEDGNPQIFMGGCYSRGKMPQQRWYTSHILLDGIVDKRTCCELTVPDFTGQAKIIENKQYLK